MLVQRRRRRAQRLMVAGTLSACLYVQGEKRVGLGLAMTDNNIIGTMLLQ